MRTKKRRERDREKMREAILSAAKQLFVKEGFDNVSMRRIGAAIDYSPAAIYRYFKNKREILSTLRDEGFKRFVKTQEKRRESYPNPLERLKDGGRGYVRFALQEPDYFHLMFCTNCEQVELEGELARSAMQSFELFRSTVAECVESGCFGDVSVDIVVVAMWANVQGLAELITSGRLDFMLDDAEIDLLLDKVFDFQLRP